MTMKAGDKAPNFKTTNQNGEQVELSDFLGKKIILYFYPRDMTSGCTAQACNLRDNYSKLKKLGYEVFGVSTDSEKSHQKFISKENLPFQLLSDVDKSVHLGFHTWVEKSMYGRKYMGTSRSTFIINEEGIVTNIIDKVKTKNHFQQIVELLSKNNE